MSTEQPVSNCNMTRLLQNSTLSNSLNCSWTADSGGAFFSESGFRDSFLLGLTLQSSECFDSGNPIYDQSLTVKTVLKSGDLLEAALERTNVKITSSKHGGTSTTWIPRPHPNLVGVCIVLVFVIGFLFDQNSGSLVLLKLDCNWTTDSGGADLVCLCSSVIG